MTECSRCGDCCERIVYPWAPEAVADLLAQSVLPEEMRRDLEFVRDHWHYLGDHRSAEDGARNGVPADDPAVSPVYSCDAFDPVSRLCTAHDARPSVCDGYPWYGRPPAANVLSPRCSFTADVRPLLPVVGIGDGRTSVDGRPRPAQLPT
ncbi:MAG: YkgJ family cysteine cluster protein [Motilibacteraceae bacterium]